MQQPNNTIETRMHILALTWPIFIEISLRMLFMNVDVFMLSMYSDKAVAAVGLITQIGFFIMILFMMVSSGAGIVISQYNGAKRYNEVANVIVGSISLAAVFGLFVSLLMFFLAPHIVEVFKLEPEVRGYAYQYLVIFGSFSFVIAMSSIFAAILRSHGYTREPMFINMGANVLNVIGNYCFIFGPFGIPVLGVKGVAISTVFAHSVAATAMFLMLRKKGIAVLFHHIGSISGRIYKSILRIGLPNGGEMLSYNLAQITMLYLISLMGAASMMGETSMSTIFLTSHAYGQSIMRFVVMFALSLGNGTQILIGYLVGAGRLQEAYREVFRIFAAAFVIAFCLAGTIVIFREPIIRIFTDNKGIINLTATLLICSIALETGRTFNLVFINALKGSGDVNFPVKIGILSMWGLGVGFSCIFGLKFGMGVLGVWMAVSLDEWIRGIIMLFRWRSRIWEQKAVVKPQTSYAA